MNHMKTRFLNCFKKLKRTNLLTLVFILCVSNGLAQNLVSGNVSDEVTKQPIPGVTILIKDSIKGTTTDFDGNFTIEVSTTDILVVSYLGYLTQEIEVNDTLDFTLLLREDTSELDEVIVVGYGTKSKQKIISAVSIVDEEALKALPVATVSNGLEGLASGLPWLFCATHRQEAYGAEQQQLLHGLYDFIESGVRN